MCNLWWGWLLVGMVLGFVVTMGLGDVLALGDMNRKEEERDQRNNH